MNWVQKGSTLAQQKEKLQSTSCRMTTSIQIDDSRPLIFDNAKMEIKANTTTWVWDIIWISMD